MILGLTTVLALSLATQVLAQTSSLSQLPACGATCASKANCALATPECICPSESTIHTCIDQNCSASDQSSANAILTQFCQGQSTTTTSDSTTTTPSSTTSSTTLTTQPPSNTSTSTTTPGETSSSTTSSTLTPSQTSPIPLSTSTSIALPTSTFSLPTPIPLNSNTFSPSPVVVVTSTQVPAAPTSFNAAVVVGPPCDSIGGLVISAVVTGFAWIFIF